ncbi:hypothetical protein FOA52_013548 [Chlamydomonas sp. UWO 241]|nr:hypothetical protein FOA52_013548 [Chlamydomonas sp. UWO 241]
MAPGALPAGGADGWGAAPGKDQQAAGPPGRANGRDHDAPLASAPAGGAAVEEQGARPSEQPPLPPLATLAEVQAAARKRGLSITLATLGPGYRIECREAAGSGSSGGGDGKLLAVTNGFVVPPPFGLMHCDTLQVFTKGLKGEQGQRVRGGVLGLGLLLGGATFAHGHACGCTTAEILAINDDDATHARLVLYYSYFGFKPARFAADRGQMITIVSAYSPTEAASDEEAGDFYLRVAALADKANDKRDLLIVAAVQRDRERWIGQQVAEAQDMLRKKNLRQFARACDRLAGRSRSHQIPPAMRDVSGALHSGPDGVLKAMTESFDKLYGGETKLSDETLNQLENDVAAFELTRATEVDEAHGRPPDLAETEAC